MSDYIITEATAGMGRYYGGLGRYYGGCGATPLQGLGGNSNVTGGATGGSIGSRTSTAQDIAAVLESIGQATGAVLTGAGAYRAGGHAGPTTISAPGSQWTSPVPSTPPVDAGAAAGGGQTPTQAGMLGGATVPILLVGGLAVVGLVLYFATRKREKNRRARNRRARNPGLWRVMRVAPSAVSPPCPCSHDEPEVVWTGTDPSKYHGGLGAFDEGCHHPFRWMEKSEGRARNGRLLGGRGGKVYIVYVDGIEVGMIKAGGHNAAEKTAQGMFPGRQVSVEYTEI